MGDVAMMGNAGNQIASHSLAARTLRAAQVSSAVTSSCGWRHTFSQRPAELGPAQVDLSQPGQQI